MSPLGSVGAFHDISREISRGLCGHCRLVGGFGSAKIKKITHFINFFIISCFTVSRIPRFMANDSLNTIPGMLLDIEFFYV